MGSLKVFAWDWLQNTILLISASQVARITGMRCHFFLLILKGEHIITKELKLLSYRDHRKTSRDQKEFLKLAFLQIAKPSQYPNIE
jgi:hypothetical protein